MNELQAQKTNDTKAIEEHLKCIFSILDVNYEDTGMKNTPRRIAKMWSELFDTESIEELNSKMTLFDEDTDHLEPVTMTMPFTSWCEHHLLPFYGKIRVTYKASDRIIGLSKIPRIVEHFSKRPQLQERLGKEIAEYLREITNALYVKVEIFDTVHTCVKCRGIEYDADTKTSYTAYRSDMVY